MIRIRDEGEIIKEGFNFYPLSSVSSFGFVLRIKHTIYRVRYSKFAKKWFIGKTTL